MREWLTEYGDLHMKYIGSSDTLDEYLAKLSSSEDWLLDGDGEHATY
jgi:hypothetical protein